MIENCLERLVRSIPSEMRYTKTIYFLPLFLMMYVGSMAQQTHGIKYVGENAARCGNCLSALNTMPPEVQMGITKDDDWNLYFTITNQEWFHKLFRKSDDGIAVDIITKDQIVCGGPNDFHNSALTSGHLLPPAYLKNFKSSMSTNAYGAVTIPVGQVPKALRGKEMEYNLLILQNQTLCYYNRFYNLERFRWGLLDMGLYMDSLIYGVNYDTVRQDEQFNFLGREMEFTIPFEQNKWDYRQEDIQPLYDSLHLVDYNITRIRIRAYASVEGSEERNRELQQRRAESIVEVLQSFQMDKIEKEITTSENWVEFYRDIRGTEFESMGTLTKADVKAKLTDKATLARMESILTHHRKAIVEIEIEEKIRVSESTEEVIMTFKNHLRQGRVEEAMKIQESIFARVINHQLPESILQQMEIPDQNANGLLINKQVVFNYFLHPEDIQNTYKEFKRLRKLMPKSKKIRYNLCAIKMRLWLLGLHRIDPEEFKAEIEGLSAHGINAKLINRMMINYHIIQSEYHMAEGDYLKKDQSLSYIRKHYPAIEMSDQDLLSLAQYFASYARFDWATKLLLPHVQVVNADEDLLFYYINLTIADERHYKKKSYKNVLLNAIAINSQRFCQLFDSIEKGGASFQLLVNDYLKNIYCEDCAGKYL